jgi:HK97 family phage portal protein
MLRAIFRPSQPPVGEVRAQATTWGTWPNDAPSSTSVNQTNALRLLAVTGSVQLLTESIATLPVDVFRKTSAGRVEVATPTWLKEPVVGLTFIDWASQVLTSLLLHGNAYLVVTRSENGAIVEVTPVDPQEVTVERDGTMGGRKRYIVKGKPFAGEMVHIKGMMLPGTDEGLSPLDFARQSIELGLTAQQYGIDNFDGGLNMPGVIEYPGAVEPGRMTETAKLWQRARRKGMRGLPGVLEGGGTFKPTGVTNEAAQFLESRQWTAAEICAQVYLVDPRELGIPLTGSTLEYVNSESRMANLVRKGMLRWITRMELAISSLLPQPQYMKFNVNGFMRGDSTQRWEQYAKASRINAASVMLGMGPVMLTDEMRALEEMDPLTDADMPTPLGVPSGFSPLADESSDDRNAALIAATRAEVVAEMRSMMAERAPVAPNITVNAPDVRVESPQVHVDAERIADAMMTRDAPVIHVNVEPTPVTVNNTVDVEPTPVTVSVPEQSAPTVNVSVDVPKTKHRVVRDASGNIIEVIEEQV